jgi:putative N-acetyltransferase (TIGR04045 family)
MTDPSRVWDREVRPFVSPQVSAELADAPWQLLAYHRLRREIFCDEQGLFTHSDLDEFDREASAIVALSHVAGMPDEVVGVVRIYQAEPGVWFGGRLGVSRRYRRHGAVGTALIECAVSTAHARGCREFFACVQLANVRYFERHAFRPLEILSVQGRAHRLMQADLQSYPPALPKHPARAA